MLAFRHPNGTGLDTTRSEDPAGRRFHAAAAAWR